MDKFSCDASRISWSLFCKTGKISYYLLYSNLENNALQNIEIEEEELSL